MAGTTGLGLPYPSSTDPDNVPGDLQSLAQYLDPRLPLLRRVQANTVLGPVTTGNNAGAGSTIDTLVTPTVGGTRRYFWRVAGTAIVTGGTLQMYAQMVVNGATVGTIQSPTTIGYNVGSYALESFGYIDLAGNTSFSVQIQLVAGTGAGSGSLYAPQLHIATAIAL